MTQNNNSSTNHLSYSVIRMLTGGPLPEGIATSAQLSSPTLVALTRMSEGRIQLVRCFAALSVQPNPRAIFCRIEIRLGAPL
jgi:hypothetical protein